MRQFFFSLAALFSATVNQGEISAAPPPQTEVYAVASDRTRLEWSVYTPVGSGPWPAVLVIHGGNFYGGDLSDPGVIRCAQDLAAAGYVAFAIDYRLAPPGTLPGQRSLGRFPDQYEDVRLAVQAARDDARCNGKVGSVGGSAGGTHTAWAAATGSRGRDRIEAGISLSGAYDFTDFRPDANLALFIDAVTNYVGVPQTDTLALRSASPAWILDRSIAPLYLVDSVGDLMPSAQLDDMVGQLKASGVRNFQAMSIPGSGHSFENWSPIKSQAMAFLAANLGKGRR